MPRRPGRKVSLLTQFTVLLQKRWCLSALRRTSAEYMAIRYSLAPLLRMPVSSANEGADSTLAVCQAELCETGVLLLGGGAAPGCVTTGSAAAGTAHIFSFSRDTAVPYYHSPVCRCSGPLHQPCGGWCRQRCRAHSTRQRQAALLIPGGLSSKTSRPCAGARLMQGSAPLENLVTREFWRGHAFFVAPERSFRLQQTHRSTL